jgi:hypothetical protein
MCELKASGPERGCTFSLTLGSSRNPGSQERWDSKTKGWIGSHVLWMTYGYSTSHTSAWGYISASKESGGCLLEPGKETVLYFALSYVGFLCCCKKLPKLPDHRINWGVHWQMNGWRQCALCAHNGVLFSHKKDDLVICIQVDGTGGCFVNEISHMHVLFLMWKLKTVTLVVE